MKHVRGGLRAVSSVLAVLLLIAIIVIASVVVYAWFMGYLGSSTETVEEAIRIASMANDVEDVDLLVYVQNIGEASVQLDQAGCLYVDGELVFCTVAGANVSGGVATLGKGKTATLRYAGGAALPDVEVTVKVTTVLGTSAEDSGYPGGTTENLPPQPVLDHFVFDTIESPQVTGEPFNVTVRAIDQYDDVFTGYSGVNDLVYSNGAISPAATGSFVDGTWTGEVTVTGSATDATITTVAQSNVSWVGTSNTFNVSATPHSMLWNITFGGRTYDRAYSVVNTTDGGYAIAGPITYPDSACGYGLVKTDADGNIEWNQTYGGVQVSPIYLDYSAMDMLSCSLVTTSDGGYALAGLTWPYWNETKCVVLIKTDASGEVMWNRTYYSGTDVNWHVSLVATSDGGYAIAESYRLIKTNENGTMEWEQSLGGMSYSLIETVDGGYAVAGYKNGDFWLAKTNSTGHMEWSMTYGGTGADVAYSLVAASDGGYALAGRTASFGAGGNDVWLVKTDANGNMQWNQTYGGTDFDRAYSLIVTPDGEYVMAGVTGSFGAGRGDFWLVKTNELGDVEWNQTYGGTESDWALSLIVTPDGGYAMAGYTWSYGAGMEDFWLVKTD